MPRGKRSAAWRGGPSWSIAAASILQLAVLTWPLMSQAADSETPRQTFSIDYIVTIPHAGATTAQVRWELAGIEEIERLTLRFPDTGASEITGSGQLVRHDNHVVWTPSKPYAHLSYTIELNHVRGTQHRFDSYATDSWIVTRARQLFPIIHMEAKERNGVTPKSRARLIFRLPKGWQSIAALPKEAPDVFRLADPAQILDRPFGWYVLGHFTVDRQEIAGIMVSIARVPGVTSDPAETFRFLGATLPMMQRILTSAPERILIANAPDPMWRGGISSRNSFYMHAGRPLRTADRTSPYLHEFFHVLQPFRSAPDSDWLIEGLAEFYSLELQRRAGLLDERKFFKGLQLFERYGLWNVDLRRQRDNAATNNSAPLVLYSLDQRIQRATAGRKRLDDVVHELARSRTSVDTAKFQDLAGKVAGKKFTKFFERHVIRGEAPNLREAQ